MKNLNDLVEEIRICCTNSNLYQEMLQNLFETKNRTFRTKWRTLWKSYMRKFQDINCNPELKYSAVGVSEWFWFSHTMFIFQLIYYIILLKNHRLISRQSVIYLIWRRVWLFMTSLKKFGQFFNIQLDEHTSILVFFFTRK